MAEDKAERVQNMERSVETLESQLREQIARTRAGATTTLVIGIIIVAIIGIIYFSQADRIREAMEPTNLVDSLTGMTEPKLDELLQNMEANLKDEAPENVKAIRQRVMAQIPALRKQLEGLAEGEMDKFIAQLEGKADEIVNEIIAEHQKELGPLVDAAVQKDAQQELEDEFTKQLEALIGRKMDEIMVEFKRDMTLVEMRLDRLLRPDDQLNGDEKFEKECIVRMLIYIDDVMTKQPIERKPS